MKNKILKGITYFAAVLFLLAGSALDEPSWLPNIICAGSLIWLTLFLIANRKRVIKLW